jgi:hypothetical protein
MLAPCARCPLERGQSKTKGFIERVGGWAGLRVGFININDMYNNDVGKGGTRGYEAHKVK